MYISNNKFEIPVYTINIYLAPYYNIGIIIFENSILPNKKQHGN